LAAILGACLQLKSNEAVIPKPGHPKGGISKSLTVTESAREDLDWGNAAIRIGSVVVHVGSMLNGEGPQCCIFKLGPVKCSMNHVGTGSGGHKPNGRFGYAILPFGSNATIADGLSIG